MPSNTAVAISAERPFLRRMVTGITAAGGSVQSAENLKEAYPHLGHAEVVFYHAHQKPDPDVIKLGNLLKGSRRLVVLVPRTGIADMLEYLIHERVGAVVSAGAVDAATLAGIASRSFFGNTFGLERYLPFGVRVHTHLIGDYHEKTVGMGTISTFAKEMGVRRKYLENIERVADELLMNALYDAPLVATQLGIVAEAEKAGSSLQGRMVLQYACDGDVFGLGVTDHFGALQKNTLVEYVGRCLTSARPLNQTTGSGAGLGLYIVTNSVSQLIVSVSQGVATEVIALFDLRAPKIRLTHLSFSSSEPGAALQQAGSRSGRRRPPAEDLDRSATPLSVKLVLAFAVVVLCAAAGLLIWNRLAPETRGHLVIRTEPPGAAISVNGTSRGQSPDRGRGLLVANLDPGRYTVIARKGGYALHDPVVVTVRAGRRTPVLIRLRRLLAALKVVSSPPGATLTVDGKPRGKTPVVLKNLVPGAKTRLSLSLTGYQRDQRVVAAPAAGQTDAVVVELRLSPEWGQLDLTSNLRVPDVLLNGKSLGVPLPLRGFRLPVGTHKLVLVSGWPYLRHRLTVQIPKAGHVEKIHVNLGRVRPKEEHKRIFWDGRYRKGGLLVPVGLYTFRIKDTETGKVKRHRLLVKRGRTTYVRF